MSDVKILQATPCEHNKMFLGGHEFAVVDGDELVWKECPGPDWKFLFPSEVARIMGDTFIDWNQNPPEEQWERVFQLLEQYPNGE